MAHVQFLFEAGGGGGAFLGDTSLFSPFESSGFLCFHSDTSHMRSTWAGTRLIFLAFFPAPQLMLNVHLCGSMKSWGHVQLQFHTRDSNPESKTINWRYTYFRLNVFTSSFSHIRCTYAKKWAPHSYITLVQQVSPQAPLLRMSSIWGWSSLFSPQKSRSSLPPIHLDVICLGRR